MPILRPENDFVVADIMEVTKYVMGKTHSEDVDTSLINARIGMVANAILDNEYKKMYMKAKEENNTIQGLIKPKASSWLNLIKKSTNTELENFGLTKADTEVLDNIAGRLKMELSVYKNKYVGFINNYSDKMEEYLKTLNETPIVENGFDLSTLAINDIYENLKEKGWLNAPMVDNVLGFDSIPLPEGLNKDINNIKSDLEIGILAKESFKNLDEDTLNFISGVFISNTPADFTQKLSNATLKDVNGVIIITILLVDSYKNASGEDAIVIGNMVKQSLNVLHNTISLFTTLENNSAVVMGVSKDDKTMTIYVNEKNYNKYIEDNGSMKTIIGSIFDKINVLEADPFMFRTMGIFANDLVIDKDKFNMLRDSVQNAYTLKTKNEAAGTLRNYYLFAFDALTEHEDSLKYRKDIETYLNSLTLGELNDIYRTTMEITEHVISKGTNFRIFSEAMREAKEVLGKDEPAVLAAYGSLKLFLLYMIGQTTII